MPYAEIANPQSLNKYTYVYNNPLQFIDPDGHQGQQKKGIIEELLEYLGRIWKGQNAQDGMMPNSGNGEAQKPEFDGQLGDTNRLMVNSLKETGQRAEEYSEVIATVDPTGISDFSLGWMKGDPNRLLFALGGALLHVPGGNIGMKEAKVLVGAWGKGTYKKVSESITDHFARHGFEVGAENVVQYMRKAYAFASNLKGARKILQKDGTTWYGKNGYYVIKDEVGKIVSYGRAYEK